MRRPHGLASSSLAPSASSLNAISSDSKDASDSILIDKSRTHFFSMGSFGKPFFCYYGLALLLFFESAIFNSSRSGQYPLDVFVEFIPVNETRNYVKLVLRNLIYYKGQKNEGRVSSDLFALSLPPPPFTAR